MCYLRDVVVRPNNACFNKCSTSFMYKGVCLCAIQSVGIDREKIVLIGPPPCVESAWRAVCEMRG